MADESAKLERGLRRAAGRLAGLASELERVDASNLTADEWLHLRARIGNLMADFDDSAAAVDRTLDIGGAYDRILRYLRLRVGERVTMAEVSGVAGIHEWARRVRELREDGWPIHSAVTRADLHVGEYLLEADRRDPDLASDWATAKKMRKLRTIGGPVAPKQRMLEYLKAISPRAADKEQLAHVAGSTRESERLLAELADDGWRILSSDDDRTLGAGERRIALFDR